MAITYKDIDLLSQKSSVVGTEKIPVSDTEYITPSQIVEDQLDDLNFVTYPTFSIDDSNMHLKMSSPDSSSLSLFSLDSDGHLIMTV